MKVMGNDNAAKLRLARLEDAVKTRLATWLEVLGPVHAAFIGSLVLSLVAVQGSLINRDGVLYLEIARAFLEGGLMAGWQAGDSNFFLPALIAALTFVTKLSPEITAHLLNALFMAGACALLVDITRRRLPEAAWLACLVVLAMPAYNEYRDNILREYGFWFFCLLAFWLAMRWSDTQRLRDALLCQIALAVAALFRLEAMAFFPALMLWQAFGAPAGYKMQRILAIGGLFLVGALLAVAFFASGLVAPPGRLLYYLEAANPLHTLQIINEAGGRMAEVVFAHDYSHDEAGYILFFGLLVIIPVKFLPMFGVFIVPLAFAFVVQPARAVLARWQPLPWVFLAYLLALVAFVTYRFFLTGRYVSTLNLLTVPLVAGGLWWLIKRFPRLKALMLTLALLTMVANVVSLSPRKTHILEAATWLAANVAEPQGICMSNRVIAYYAGWPSKGIVLERSELDQALTKGHCAMLVLEAKNEDTGFDGWLAANRFQEVQRFSQERGDAVVIAVPQQ